MATLEHKTCVICLDNDIEHCDLCKKSLDTCLGCAHRKDDFCVMCSKLVCVKCAELIAKDDDDDENVNVCKNCIRRIINHERND